MCVCVCVYILVTNERIFHVQITICNPQYIQGIESLFRKSKYRINTTAACNAEYLCLTRN